MNIKIYHKSHYIEYEGDTQCYDLNPGQMIVSSLVKEHDMEKIKKEDEKKGFKIIIKNKKNPTRFHPSKVLEILDYSPTEHCNYMFNSVVLSHDEEIFELLTYGKDLYNYYSSLNRQIPEDLEGFKKRKT